MDGANSAQDFSTEQAPVPPGTCGKLGGGLIGANWAAAFPTERAKQAEISAIPATRDVKTAALGFHPETGCLIIAFQERTKSNYNGEAIQQ